MPFIGSPISRISLGRTCAKQNPFHFFFLFHLELFRHYSLSVSGSVSSVIPSHSNSHTKNNFKLKFEYSENPTHFPESPISLPQFLRWIRRLPRRSLHHFTSQWPRCSVPLSWPSPPSTSTAAPSTTSSTASSKSAAHRPPPPPPTKPTPTPTTTITTMTTT